MMQVKKVCAKGFTLIEIMIVVAIIGILSSIALPAYQKYVLRSHRTAAVSALQDLASRETTFYSTNNAYTASLTTLGYSSDPYPVPNASDAFYNITASVTATSFTLTATAINSQLKDTDCGNFVINDLGVKTESGSSTSELCWGN